MNTMLILASLSPITLASIAIFIGVTAFAWVIIGRISGDDKPRAEARLDALKKGRSSAGDLDESAGD
ncbi:MAG: type II secretion system F family protein, partial [Planctomycetota bacterium]